LAENTEVGENESKWVFNVFLHKYFLNDYMKHVVETNCKLMGKKIFQKYQILTYFHILP